MSNPKLQAANELQRFANQFRFLPQIAADLQEVGSLEQAGDEAKRRLDALHAAIAKDTIEHDEAERKREQEVERKKQHAEEHLAKEKALAEQVEANAKDAAGKMLAEAHAEAKEIIEEARAMAAGHLASCTEHRAALAATMVEHASVKRDIEDAKREHNRLTQMIADLKAKF